MDQDLELTIDKRSLSDWLMLIIELFRIMNRNFSNFNVFFLYTAYRYILEAIFVFDLFSIILLTGAFFETVYNISDDARYFKQKINSDYKNG